MARSPDPALRLRWKRLVIDQQRSSLSVSEFCEQHEISNGSFYQWRKKISGQPSNERGKTTSTAHNAFLPIELDQRADGANAFRVRLANKAIVDIPLSEVDVLLQVISKLGETSEGATL